MKLLLVERNQVLVPKLNVKFTCSTQNLILHCQSELCVTYCTKRKDKGNIKKNVIVATHLITVKGWRKMVTTFCPQTPVFNQAMKKSMCRRNFLSLLLKYFFSQYGSTDAFLPAY